MQDVTKPQVGPPPRAMEGWTTVVGHQVVRVTHDRDACSCGWSSEPGDHEALKAHLRDAWPRLLVRESDESFHDFYDRVAAAHDEALQALAKSELDGGIGVPIRPGAVFPLLTDEMDLLRDRVEVLAHDLDLMRARIENEL